MHAQYPPSKRIAVLNRDLFFGVRLKQIGKELGFAVHIAADAGGFLDLLAANDVALGIIDINAQPDWSRIASGIVGTNLPPILAFGPHLEVDGLRAAKAAGVTRVVSNGTFHRDAATLIERYATSRPANLENDQDPEFEER
jgi:hypothetical protein